MSKYQDWYDSLPASTKEYLKNQPLWYDRDLAKAFCAGILCGILVGLCI